MATEMPADEGELYYDAHDELFWLVVRDRDTYYLYDDVTRSPEDREPFAEYEGELAAEMSRVSEKAVKNPEGNIATLETLMANGDVETPLTGQLWADYKWCQRVLDWVK